MFPPPISRCQTNAELLLWKGKDCHCKVFSYFFQKLGNWLYDFLKEIQAETYPCNPSVYLSKEQHILSSLLI